MDFGGFWEPSWIQVGREHRAKTGQDKGRQGKRREGKGKEAEGKGLQGKGVEKCRGGDFALGGEGFTRPLGGDLLRKPPLFPQNLSLGRLFEASWALLGSSWGVLSASWGVLGRLLGILWDLGPSWGVLGASWERWGVLGASWGRLGAPWGIFGASWDVLGLLRTSWGVLGASWGRLGGQHGSNLAPKTEPKSIKNRSQNQSFFECLLGLDFYRFLMDFGRKMEPNWQENRSQIGSYVENLDS